MAYFIELLINGALTGLMYSLVGLGFVLIYKSAGVPNLAQGAVVMTAGYAVWLFLSWGLPVWLAIPAAMVVMFLFGLIVERLLLRRMVGQPVIMVVMLTLGLDILLRGLVPGILGASPKPIDLGIGFAPVIIGDVFINRTSLYGGIIALLLVGASLLFSAPGWGPSCARSRMTISQAGRSASRSSGPSASHGGWPASRRWSRDRCGAASRASTGRCPCCCFRPLRWSFWAASTRFRAWFWAG